ncbi:hypothetical protein M404DRAFT_533646 [Pisolithus tinctorius Marx 270]|uniref:Uncharacterized protein n=1 Tax=Pisolithus tinctorius Marx 270 TaxID=870435 RepID=A0A0C3K686_PISTI|nr:hypothetical protein M404DRAFT_533646 [Pisolithus tinctorius Marx 270]
MFHGKIKTKPMIKSGEAPHQSGSSLVAGDFIQQLLMFHGKIKTKPMIKSGEAPRQPGSSLVAGDIIQLFLRCRSISCLPQGRNPLDGLNWRNLAAPRTMPPMDLVECLEFVASPLKAKHWKCKNEHISSIALMARRHRCIILVSTRRSLVTLLHPTCR